MSSAEDKWGGDPIVIDPPGFDPNAGWKEHSDYVEQCGGLTHEDGDVNWRAAFGADPGICSCPACHTMYWAFGRKQRCRACNFEYPTDAWPMYSYGVQAFSRKNGGGKFAVHTSLDQMHEERMSHPYYRYGFEHPPEEKADVHAEYKRINWRTVFPAIIEGSTTQ